MATFGNPQFGDPRKKCFCRRDSFSRDVFSHTGETKMRITKQTQLIPFFVGLFSRPRNFSLRFLQILLYQIFEQN